MQPCENINATIDFNPGRHCVVDGACFPKKHEGHHIKRIIQHIPK